MLIELLAQIGSKFYQVRVRSQTLRHRIEEVTKQYMNKVETELEMRYLLLEKDFEDRDALDLITIHKIYPMLESKFADNVVKEISMQDYDIN